MISIVEKQCTECGTKQEWIVAHPRPPFSCEFTELSTRKQPNYRIVNGPCWCKNCSTPVSDKMIIEEVKNGNHDYA